MPIGKARGGAGGRAGAPGSATAASPTRSSFFLLGNCGKRYKQSSGYGRDCYDQAWKMVFQVAPFTTVK